MEMDLRPQSPSCQRLARADLYFFEIEPGRGSEGKQRTHRLDWVWSFHSLYDCFPDTYYLGRGTVCLEELAHASTFVDRDSGSDIVCEL